MKRRRSDKANEGTSRAWRTVGKIATVLAAVAACCFAVLLGVRRVSNADLGYHLAYGEAFWATGRPVDHNGFLYTLPPRDTPPAQRPPPGPGCWYDRQGRYRFPNANWLTQAIMAGAYRLGGAAALSALGALVVAGIVAVSVSTLRNLKVPWGWAGGGILLIALAAYGRFRLRPELFGFLLLAAQLCLLTRTAEKDAADRWRPSWPAFVGIVALQILQANVHSYFLLGLALTAAVLTDRLARLAWGRLARRHQAGPADPRLKQGASRLGVLLAAQAAACLVNPWTWRIAALPFQTLLFLRRHNIAAHYNDSGHPWAFIGEFLPPFRAAGAWASKATWAYCGVLAIAACGGLAALIKRRWGLVAILAGMTAISLSMRRNVPPAAMVIVPLAVAGLWRPAETLAQRLSGRRQAIAACLAAAAVAGVSLWLSWLVVSHCFYADEGETERFGLGLSAWELPLGGAKWLNDHRPTGRMWTDYHSAGQWHFFTRPHRPVPIITNTWAYPPKTLDDFLLFCGIRPKAGQLAFRQIDRLRHRAIDQYGLEIAALRYDSAPRLTAAFAMDPAWELVNLEGLHFVFLRSGEGAPNAALARRAAITPSNLITSDYIGRVEALDPLPGPALRKVGRTLYGLQADIQALRGPQAPEPSESWFTPAIALVTRSLDHDPKSYKALHLLGLAYARRGDDRLARRDVACLADFQKARECFQQAVGLRPGDNASLANLRMTEAQIQRLRRSLGPERH